MDKNIVALLNNNFRVIVPEFGAFIIKQKEPKIIVFNEFLKYDDGLLIEFMVKTEGIEKEMAQQQLSDFTGYAIKVLEGGNTLTIEGLGTLQKENNGKIVFTAVSEIKKPVTSQKTKRTPKSVSKITQEVHMPKEAEPMPEAPEPMVITTTTEVPESTVVTTTPEVKGTLELETPFKTSPLPVVVPAQTVKATGYWSKQAVKWFLIILSANIVIIAFFVFQGNIRSLFKAKNEPYLITDSLFNQLSDSVRVAVADTSLTFRETSTAISVEENTPLQGNLRYYIVAGCFRDEINADDLVKSLRKRGFNAEKFGKIGNLHAVSFVSFDDKELAVKELKRIREDIYSEAWMTRF
jgi:nucleoid DNA-binding protein